MRNDASLYTGKTEAYENRQKLKKEEKQEKQLKLEPSAEIVFEKIDKERTKVLQVTDIELEKPNEKDFMVDLMARKRYVQYLTNLKNELSILLRKKDE